MAHADTQSPASKKLESRPKKAKDSPTTEDDTKLEKKDKKKRKKFESEEAAPETDGELKKKKKRRHAEDDGEQKDKDTESRKKKKRVSFGPGTKENDGDSDSDSDAAESNEAAVSDGADADIEDKEADKALEEMKKRKREKKKQRKTGTVSTEGQIHETPILSYLSHYHRARETWKFQKNRETNLFKHLYSLEHVPARYNTSLLVYIQGLKGDAAKQRMSDAARDVIKADMDLDKPKDDEAEETTDPAYQQAIESFRERLSEGSEDLDNSDIPEELSADAQKRLPKRQRGELVFFAVTGKLFSAEDAKPKRKPKVVEPPANKKRKNRTMVVDISSSESDSDDDTPSSKKSVSKSAPDISDDETSSSGSSSDSSSSSSDSDDSDAVAPTPAPAKQPAPTSSGPSEVAPKKNAKKQKFVPEKKEPKAPKKTQKRKLRTAQIEISSSESDSD
ncbi:unnamed protein product [Penicillium olsonii]|nr:unnamed protein product [Penicillium olsonii]